MHRGGALGWLLKHKWGRERVSYRQKKGHIHIPGGVKVRDLFRKSFRTAAAKEVGDRHGLEQPPHSSGTTACIFLPTRFSLDHPLYGLPLFSPATKSYHPPPVPAPPLLWGISYCRRPQVPSTGLRRHLPSGLHSALSTV